jgi:GT2 family glycosyltransferase/glycosyltransferase involved in cell wall biosynthesis
MKATELQNGMSKPTVSVIIANYNGAAYLLDAISSVQKQSLEDIEIIVCDDGSTDDSLEIIRGLMTSDGRIRLLGSDYNQGPGAARNRGLENARGKWIAIVDSDDLIHPLRFDTLINSAERDGADVVADDLLFFDSNNDRPPTTLLSGRWATAPFWVDTRSYIRLNKLYGRGPILGYLKPIFRSDLIGAGSIRYNTSLRVGEDYHLMLTLLSAGAKFRVYPQLLCFYRRHSASISHRLQMNALEALKAADLQLIDETDNSRSPFYVELNARVRSIDAAEAYDEVLTALKAREWLKACRALVCNPMALPLLRFALGARLRRLTLRSKAKQNERGRRQVCVLSRQRVVGRTNGSSVYLLDLVAALAKNGTDVHFISPSPTTLGRWPFLALSDDLSVFKTMRVRGTWRLGRYLVSRDPRVFIQGALAVCDKLLVKVGLTRQAFSKRAAYSIAQPLTRADQLFVAQHCPKLGDFLIADYCFLTDTFPYALRPDAGTAVVMHDRISSRLGQFVDLKRQDIETILTEQRECELLGQADSIVTIQWGEAEFVRRHLPTHCVIVAPIAAHPVAAPQPGRDDRIVFVGSAAAPNVDGLTWFIEHCWKTVKSLHPGAELHVAGTVTQFMGPMPEGVRVLGLVRELDLLYRDAAVVISPLRIGSGLKIKLIEALSYGKAVVGSAKTLQGVEQYLADTILVEDDPDGFAQAVVGLLKDKAARISLASRGMDKLRAHFTPEQCYADFVSAVEDRCNKSSLT